MTKPQVLAILQWVLMAIGGLTAVWASVMQAVPRLFARLIPITIRAVDVACAVVRAWLGAHPVVRAAVLANLPQIKELAQAIVSGLQQLADAAQAEAKKDLAPALQPAPTPPPAQ